MASRSTRPRLWPAAPLLALGIGLAILALPASVEGPPLVSISPGRTLSLIDGAGAALLTIGALWTQSGLWRRRARLARWSAARPGAGAAVLFGAGLGIGLLIASAFSKFFWWWAIGAVVLAAAGGTLVAVARRPTEQRSS